MQVINNDSHLDDKKYGGGRVEGPVIKSDDGGTMCSEQVSDLKGKHFKLLIS